MVEEIEEIMEEEDEYPRDVYAFKNLVAKTLFAVMCKEMSMALVQTNKQWDSFFIDIEDNAYGGKIEPCVTLYRKTKEFDTLRSNIGKAFGESTTDYSDINTLVKRCVIPSFREAVSRIYYNNNYLPDVTSEKTFMDYLAPAIYSNFESIGENTERMGWCSFMGHSSYGGCIELVWKHSES